jgi:hypothetical protein
MGQIFVDHQLLAKIAGAAPDDSPCSPDLAEFLDDIRAVVGSLDELASKIIIMYHFESLEFDQIAAELGLKVSQIKKIHSEAFVNLKYRLAEMVNRRWPGKFPAAKHCPICDHPKRQLIDRIIASKHQRESWGTINKRLKAEIGRSFHPPSLLINHQKYHQKG